MSDPTGQVFISDDLQALLLELRQIRAGWLADEIEQVIQGGSLKDVPTTVPGHQSKIAEVPTVVPYSPEEQLLIFVETLQHHVIGTHRMWQDIQQELSSALGNPHLTISIEDINGQVINSLFNPNFPDFISDLQEVLSKLTRKLGH